MRKKTGLSNRVFLTSQELEWVEYHSQNSSLTVEFVSGGIYRYDEVPAAEYRALLAADSRGRYFNAHIRGHYPYVRLS